MSQIISHPSLAISRFNLIPRVASGVGILVSSLVLIGWGFNVPALRSILTSQPQMVPNTALTFIIASASLWMLWENYKSQRASVLACVCALVVIMIGLLTLIEYITVSDLGFDRLLFRQKLQLTTFPGRPSPHTAFSFLLIGSALLLIWKKTVWTCRLAQILALATSLVALMAFIGYVYQVASLYKITSTTGMALPTAFMFVILSVGILFLHPDSGLMSFIMSETAGGVMLRHLLPATIAIPVAAGGLIIVGAREGFYDMGFGMMLSVVASIVILTTLIWRNARTLHLADTRRKQAEEASRSAYDDLERRVSERTLELSNVNETLRGEVIEHRESEAGRAQLLRRLVNTQEEERRRISRELHDEMGQQLAALMLGLKTLSASSENGTTAQKKALQQLHELTVQLVEETHHLAWELRPAALDDLGLQTALSNYVEKWSERGGVVADFHSNGLNNRRLPPQIETAVYRLVQEALTNILKHARANRVSVILEHHRNQLLTIVEDDGQGFDVETVRFETGDGHSLGLLGIRERVALIGGSLNIESHRGAGTTLVMRVTVSTLAQPEVFPREYATHLIGR